ncbi:unnamed protein product [Linum trigynum]|uniref:Uncharacterized protein n=1 Tax=Linum trigynum TaxID=586398 RepID=A0AAV2FX08_9ROSI
MVESPFNLHGVFYERCTSPADDTYELRITTHQAGFGTLASTISRLNELKELSLPNNHLADLRLYRQWTPLPIAVVGFSFCSLPFATLEMLFWSLQICSPCSMSTDLPN